MHAPLHYVQACIDSGELVFSFVYLLFLYFLGNVTTLRSPYDMGRLSSVRRLSSVCDVVAPYPEV